MRNKKWQMGALKSMDKEMRNMAKKNLFLYGAGNNLLFSYCDLARYYNIVAIADGNPAKAGKRFFDFKICSIADVADDRYDMLAITPADNAGIRENLIQRGIDAHKIFDLQSVLDRIPDAEWKSGAEKKDSADREQSGAQAHPTAAVVFYGGMGDLLIGKQWLRCVVEKYQMDSADFFLYFARNLTEDARTIFGGTVPEENLYGIDTEKKSFFAGKTYDVIFRFCILPEVWYRKTQPGYIDNPEFLSYVDRLDRYGREHYNRGFFASNGFSRTVRSQLVERQGVKYHTAYDVFGEFEESEGLVKTEKPWRAERGTALPGDGFIIANTDGEEAYLSEIGLKGKSYITLNTGLNREYLQKRNTRAWPFEYWRYLAVRIKEAYPDLMVVQVGIRMRTEDDIPADIHMNGVTNLGQISILLKHALVHVDYDSGLVHVRHMTGGRSIVLMGPSAAEKHAYPENEYIQAPACASCEWSTSSWLSVCPRGYEEPVCMKSITVDMVMEKIDKLVECERNPLCADILTE